MLNRGVDIHNNNDSPLFYAIKSGNLKVVKILIDKGANVNVLWNYLQINCHNEYPIQFARKCGNKDIINFLIYNGAKEHE